MLNNKDNEHPWIEGGNEVNWIRISTWDSGDLGSIFSSAADLLGDNGLVISPLCASVTLSVK